MEILVKVTTVTIVLSVLILQGEALKCYTCTSDLDEICAEWGETIPKKECVDQKDECVTAVVEGTTVRGCAKEIPDLKCENECKACEGDSCNVDLVPDNRAQCHQCDSASDAACGDLQSGKPTACRNWVFRDKCYVILSDDLKTVKRGCNTDNDAPKKCAGELCKECKAVNDPGCNAIQALVKPKLKCYTCDPSEENCAWAMDESKKPAVVCKKQLILQPSEEQCFMDDQDGAVTRGCLLDLDKDDPLHKRCSSSETCTVCSKDGCNAKKSELKFHTCYKCRSTKVGEKSCDTDIKEFTPSKCSNPFQTKDQGGCYILQLVGDTIRGCTMDMPKEFQEECKKDRKFCKKCDEMDCNDAKLTPRNNSSVNRAIYYAMLITGILHFMTYM